MVTYSVRMEHIEWFVKPGAAHTFNPAAAAEPYTEDERREALAIVLRLGDQVPGRPLRVPLSGLAADLSYAVRLEAPAAGPVPGLGRFEGAGLTVAPGYLPAQGLPLQLPQPQSALVLRFTADAAPKL